ncbi:hypothetical protein MMC19_004482 [Ptychographa xylographoides]|nr:hypothetical protein [Ptychographa xylographoides]
MAIICGCYYLSQSLFAVKTQSYLPLVDSEAHTTIISTNSRTKLTQTFTNPTRSAIKECIYTFPLYDGVSVVKFTCRIGARTLRGLVKEKNQAKTIYRDAVARGETAGLLEQSIDASDVFSTKLGNVPRNESVIVEIEYVGELKQDAEANGIRFTIPTKIAPRYGQTLKTKESAAQARPNAGIKITVDALMPDGSFIQSIQSPSHPIAVAMGTTSTEAQAEPSMNKASASLSLGETSLDKDFILIVVAKDTAIPKAILETHPTIPNQRAMMVTLVPKFSLPPTHPEIVFVADRSGSMRTNIPILISALNVFLKSIPVGVKFNICSFGSSHSFLWPKSMSYTHDSLSQAISHVEGFAADMGGTETFAAIKGTIDQRYGDIPLELILLTDGDIWRQDELFHYLNQEVEKSKGDIRVFPLGIGDGVSHALIEGVARAGNGFAQTVQNGEKLDTRVVRMLKGALSSHITDYSLEVHYKQNNGTSRQSEDTDGFELVDMFEKVTDGFSVVSSDSDDTTMLLSKEEATEKAPISLFDNNANPDAEDTTQSLENDGYDRYAHLPQITHPKLLQSPHKIPPLFPFSRTSVYLLMSPDTMQMTPASVILKATSPQGPVELEIPVDILSQPGMTIHQLAAKKALQDLEEGRGWISDAKDDNGVLLKKRFPSKYDDMVEREAVRLGVEFQIAGKWCSFVAVAANDNEIDSERKEEYEIVHNEGKNSGKSKKTRGRGTVIMKRKAVSALPRESVSRYAGISAGDTRDRRYVTRSTRQRDVPQNGSCDQAAFNGIVDGDEYEPDAEYQADAPLITGSNSGLKGSIMPLSSASRTSPVVATSSFMMSMSAAPPPPAPSGFFGGASPWGSAERGGGAPQSQSRFQPAYGTPSMLMRKKSSSHSDSESKLEELSFNRQGTTSASIPTPFAGHSLFGSAQESFRGSDIQDKSEESEFSAAADSHGATPRAKRQREVHHNALYRKSQAPSAPPKVGLYDLPASSYSPASTGATRAVDWAAASDSDKVLRLIALQDFEGYWTDHEDVAAIAGLSKEMRAGTDTEASEEEKTARVTVCVVVFLEEHMRTEEGVWELVVVKARAWLVGVRGEEWVRGVEAQVRRG